MRGFVISAAFAFAFVTAFGQAGDDGSIFEVASVRPARSGNADQAISGGPGTANPGRVTFRWRCAGGCV